LRQRVLGVDKIFASRHDHQQPKALTPYCRSWTVMPFRQLSRSLHDITLNPAMGAYPNMVTSTSQAEWNYAARSCSCSIDGPVGSEGTARLDAKGTPAYDQSVVGFTKV
jgi:hypothetical protein